jgi:hypothetical protein
MSPGSFPSQGTLGVRTSKTPIPAIERPVIMRIFPRLDKGLMPQMLLLKFLYETLRGFAELVKAATAL